MLIKNYEFDAQNGTHLSLQVSDEFLHRVRVKFGLKETVEPSEEQIKAYLGSSIEKALLALDEH